MPLYDFHCRTCGERFEARTAVDAVAPCPACGAAGTERVVSSSAGPFTVGLRGDAARRSNAARRAREEQRQAGFARQREERRQQDG